ncbi:hypothetical protein CLOM_g19575 [Closterium sp. NIES-68]|nr:hypothetical protein CLOM_g19575 [Closterium sp. NIES-68]GJP84924.1 hypothetical protein CLOP_g14966 [Closterium sp. NIES-67]
MAPCSTSSQLSNSRTHRSNQLPFASHPPALPTARSSAPAAPSLPSPVDLFLRSPAGVPLGASHLRRSGALPPTSPGSLCIHPLPPIPLAPRGRGSAGGRAGVVRVRAAGSETEETQGGAGAIPPQRARVLQRPYQSSGPSARVSAFFRFLYGTATYAGLAAAAVAGARLAGLDWSGGFQPSLQGVLDGFAFSAPLIALVLALFQDRVAEQWEVVRAVRDADDAEAEDYFKGMSAWQCTVVAVSAALAEELFFRAALQAFITHTLLLSGSPSIDAPAVGMAALTGFLPVMAPCTQLCAATLTAAVAGSVYYATALPRDAVIVVTQSYSLMELRSAIRAWHERQQHQKIYPPMFASILSLYYGIEWVMTGNLLAPMLTHALLNLIVLHMSLVRMDDRQPGHPYQPYQPNQPGQPSKPVRDSRPVKPVKPANKAL